MGVRNKCMQRRAEGFATAWSWCVVALGHSGARPGCQQQPARLHDRAFASAARGLGCDYVVLASVHVCALCICAPSVWCASYVRM